MNTQITFDMSAVEAIIAQATEMARNPTTLPRMRTWNTAIAKAKQAPSTASEMRAPLAAFPASRVSLDTGALRSRFNSPRWRSSSISTPRFAIAKRRNCMAMPANEWAYPL